ncbi:MAG: signal peptidase II [Endomicrobiia bacterium]
MKKIFLNNFWWILLFLLLVFLDQYSKYLIRANFSLYQTKQILPILALTYTTNTGVVFGWFAGVNFLFVVVVTLILIFVLISAKEIIKEMGPLGKLVVCLIISGGVGNLIDRIFLGKVTDFIDLQWNYKNIWPIFNFADSYVFIGVCIVIMKYLFTKIKFFKVQKRNVSNSI